MKIKSIKKIFAVLMSFVLVICCSFAAGAETIQDRLERYRNSQENSGSSQRQGIDTSAIGDFFQGLLNGETPDIGSGSISEDVQELWDMVSGTDIGNVISEFDLQALFDMGGEAWASARDMITDAIGGGLGTSDSSNTGTRSEVTTRQVATTYVVTYDPVAPVTNAGTTVTETPTVTPTTLPSVTPNNVSPIVNVIDDGEDDTSGEEEEENKLSTASIVVIIILSVATIGVIAAVVIFFAVKKKY